MKRLNHTVFTIENMADWKRWVEFEILALDTKWNNGELLESFDAETHHVLLGFKQAIEIIEKLRNQEYLGRYQQLNAITKKASCKYC